MVRSTVNMLIAMFDCGTGAVLRGGGPSDGVDRGRHKRHTVFPGCFD